MGGNKEVTVALKIFVIENIPKLTDLPNKMSEFLKDLKNLRITSSCLTVVPAYPRLLYSHVVYVEYDQGETSDIGGT
jgi:hypothetical protein